MTGSCQHAGTINTIGGAATYQCSRGDCNLRRITVRERDKSFLRTSVRAKKNGKRIEFEDFPKGLAGL